MPRPRHLPLELLHTFIQIADRDGDAAAAAQQLGITQPSISKRLSALRRLTSDPDQQPWLLLTGKRWRLTAEGQRVRAVVADLVRRYEQVERFVAGSHEGKPLIAIACGQQAASGFVRKAVEQFLTEQPDCRVRISTPRGKARIEGVAAGQFDFAIVTDSPATIRQIARGEVYIETLFEDLYVLVANPSRKSAWGKKWNALPGQLSVAATQLLDLPFILPEPDASRRQQFDEWFFSATGKRFDVIVEAGGWQTILEFAQSGVGVGIVTRSAVHVFQRRAAGKLSMCLLDRKEFPHEAVRLIAKKMHGREEPAVTDLGRRLRSLLTESVKRSSGEGN
jgi:DNA-binding transcriptional LysR family regulator